MKNNIIAQLEDVSVNNEVVLNEDSFNFLEQSGRKIFWNQGYSGQDVIVAVVDTGVDSQHPELLGQVLPGRNFCLIDSVDPTDTGDLYGHGTHVAATIAGKLKCGIAPKCKILPVKVLDKNGALWFVDWLVSGLDYIYNWRSLTGQKVDIVNMSLGGLGFTGSNLVKLRDAVQRLTSIGINVVVSAGNNGIETAKYYPAALEEVICVGAVDLYKQHALFSNTGEMVDVCQIGVNVLSAKANSQDYIYMSGTSMATPIVSGILALMICKDKILNGKYNRAISAEALEMSRYMQLKNTTIDIGVKGTDTLYGTGFCTLNQKLLTELGFAIGNKTMRVNGKPVVMDSPAMYSNGRTMIPLRAFAEATGGIVSYYSDNDIRVLI